MKSFLCAIMPPEREITVSPDSRFFNKLLTCEGALEINAHDLDKESCRDFNSNWNALLQFLRQVEHPLTALTINHACLIDNHINQIVQCILKHRVSELQTLVIAGNAVLYKTTVDALVGLITAECSALAKLDIENIGILPKYIPCITQAARWDKKSKVKQTIVLPTHSSYWTAKSGKTYGSTGSSEPLDQLSYPATVFSFFPKLNWWGTELPEPGCDAMLETSDSVSSAVVSRKPWC